MKEDDGVIFNSENYTRNPFIDIRPYLPKGLALACGSTACPMASRTELF